MKTCPFCAEEIQDAAILCRFCHADLANPSARKSSTVAVTDVQMPFGSMVVFMIKWAFASIPAVLVIVTVAAASLAFVGGMFQALTSASRVVTSASSDEPVPSVAAPTSPLIRAGALRGASYNQVIDRLGPPTRQAPGALFYRLPDGGTVTFTLRNDHVIDVEPADANVQGVAR